MPEKLNKKELLRQTPKFEREAQLPKVLSWRNRITLGPLALLTTLSLFGCSGATVQGVESPTPSSVVTQLNDFNRILIDKPEDITTIGPQISSLATDYYCTERSCSADELTRLKGSFKFLNDNDFQKQWKDTLACTDTEKDEETKSGGLYYFGNRGIYLNNERIFRTIDGKIRENPGFIVFDFSLHELGHARPPVLKQLPNNQFVPLAEHEQTPPITIVHGVMRLNYTPGRNLDGKNCYLAYRKDLEEAVVDDNNERLLKKLGLQKTETIYYAVRTNYQEIINHLFGGDPSVLFNYHQKSQEANFVGSIGVALGYPKNQAVQAGDRFLAPYFNPIQ